MILREIIAHFGVQTDGEKAIQAISASMNIAKAQVTQLIASFGRLAGVTVGVGGIAAFVHTQAEMADNIADTADRLGISASALQAWGHAAQMSGSSAEEMEASLGMLQRSLTAVGEGGKDQARALRRLGVDYRNADGTIRPMQDILLGIAEGMEKTTDPTDRAALATHLFGRQGARLIPLLSRGRAGVQALTEEFQALGGGSSDEALAVSSAYVDNVDRMQVALFSVAQRISAFFLPAFVRLTDVMVNAARSFFSIVDRSHAVQAALLTMIGALVAVGVPAAYSLVVAFAPLIGSALAVAAGVAVIVLVLDDLITLFTGGKSLIGAFIDEMFGVGTSAEIVNTLKEAWEGLVLIITNGINAVREFMGMSGGELRRTEGRGLDADTAIGSETDLFAALSTDRDTSREIPQSTQDEIERLSQRRQRRMADARTAAAEASGAIQPREPAPAVAARSDTPTPPVVPPTRFQSDAASAVAFADPRGGGRAAVLGNMTRTGDTTVTTGPTTIAITVPQGTSREQTEAIRRTVATELERRSERDMAALQRQAVDEG